ncbi:MAG: R3H domain-containing nucleic acid-binding protein [Patescibacteria group bacterium]
MEKDKVIAIIKELVSRMGLHLKDVQVSEVAGHTLFTLLSDDSGALIGTGGETLHALNHIVKKSLESGTKTDEPFRFVVDVNGYHLKHIKMLEAQAHMLAERARTFKYDIDMSPMSPYDRMIVHASLQGSPDVLTESNGEGKLRHIVIRYKGETPPTV